MKLFGIVGWKNSGKTGLMERLVAEFVSRGVTVSTIKHAHHEFDVDQPGKDSFRHRAAGAQEVLLASANRWVLMHELRGAEEPSLQELLSKLGEVDLVLVEGFKNEDHPKIEAHRAETQQSLLAKNDRAIRAVASNVPDKVASEVSRQAVFSLDDTNALADFISAELSL